MNLLPLYTVSEQACSCSDLKGGILTGKTLDKLPQ
jgi:hypothetical protein